MMNIHDLIAILRTKVACTDVEFVVIGADGKLVCIDVSTKHAAGLVKVLKQIK